MANKDSVRFLAGTLMNLGQEQQQQQNVDRQLGMEKQKSAMQERFQNLQMEKYNQQIAQQQFNDAVKMKAIATLNQHNQMNPANPMPINDQTIQSVYPTVAQQVYSQLPPDQKAYVGSQYSPQKLGAPGISQLLYAPATGFQGNPESPFVNRKRQALQLPTNTIPPDVMNSLPGPGY